MNGPRPSSGSIDDGEDDVGRSEAGVEVGSGSLLCERAPDMV